MRHDSRVPKLNPLFPTLRSPDYSCSLDLGEARGSPDGPVVRAPHGSRRTRTRVPEDVSPRETFHSMRRTTLASRRERVSKTHTSILTVVHCPRKFVPLEEDRPRAGVEVKTRQQERRAISTMEGLLTVADEESQRANEWTGLPEDIRVVRVQVGRRGAAVTPVITAEMKMYHTYPPRRSPLPTDSYPDAEKDRYAFKFAMSQCRRDEPFQRVCSNSSKRVRERTSEVRSRSMSRSQR